MATGFQQFQNRNKENLLDELQFANNNQENPLNSPRTAQWVNINDDDDNDEDNDDDNDDVEERFVPGINDDMTSQDIFVATVNKQRRQLKRFIEINKDIVEFLLRNSKYSQELSEKLEKLSAEMELVPEKSLIIVTKKFSSRRIRDWKKRCCSVVTKFCSHFRRSYFELKNSSSAQEALPKLEKMFQWSDAAFWIDSNKTLVVVAKPSESEQILKNVREFLGNEGIEEYRSDERQLKTRHEIFNDATDHENNPFNKVNFTKVPGKKNPAKKQQQKSFSIDDDIVNFFLKRKKYSEELKGLLYSLGAELEISKSGIKMTKVGGNTIPNWEERCENTVNVFCSCFCKKYFPLDAEIRDSIPETLLSTLQRDVSSTGGASWLDKHKHNLILVSRDSTFNDAEKEVEQFFEKVRRSANRNFEVKESIHELVKKDLPTLKEALKSCNITLKKKTLVVVCLRNEVDNVAEKVESFLQRFEGVKPDGNAIMCCVLLIIIHEEH